MNLKENKRLLTEILKIARFVIVAVLLAGVCIYVSAKYKQAAEPEITSSFINGKLEAVSDLTTAELAYTGLIKYTEGSIPFLTQNSFSMVYTAKIRAGVDISKAQIKITDKQVVVTLPECVVQSIDVDTGSIEFYDERLALFNWTEKTDVIDTVTAAKEDVSKKADIQSLLEQAKRQTKTLIEGILSDAVGDRKLVIQ